MLDILGLKPIAEINVFQAETVTIYSTTVSEKY